MPYAIWGATLPATALAAESYWIEATDGSDTDYLSVNGVSDLEPVDGGWVLNGSKAFCTHGSVGEIAVVLAVSDPEGRKGRNVSAFVLEKGMAGFRSGKKENKLGIRASDTSELVLEDCFVPDENLLGAPGEGFRQALSVLDGGRISIAALGLGTAIGAYETALEYSKQREQFGHPIAEFQAIRFALAEKVPRGLRDVRIVLREGRLELRGIANLSEFQELKDKAASAASFLSLLGGDMPVEIVADFKMPPQDLHGPTVPLAWNSRSMSASSTRRAQRRQRA